MKKTIQIIAILTLVALLTSCNSTVAYPVPSTAPEVTPAATLAPTPVPTSTPVPTPEPTREPTGNHFEFAKRYCEQYGYKYTEDYAAAFLYAMYTLPTDYNNIRTDFPANLYQHPYNTWATPTLKKDYAFKTNAECIKEYGIDEINLIMTAASGYINTELNYDYSKDDEETTKKAFYYNLPPYMETTTIVSDITNARKRAKRIGIGCFQTDASLVYQCIDGMFRVRGRVFFKDSQATTSFQKENEYEIDKWFYFDIEFNVIPNVPEAGSQYEHGKYGVYNWVYISNGWTVADANMIAFAEAQMA